MKSEGQTKLRSIFMWSSRYWKTSCCVFFSKCFWINLKLDETIDDNKKQQMPRNLWCSKTEQKTYAKKTHKISQKKNRWIRVPRSPPALAARNQHLAFQFFLMASCVFFSKSNAKLWEVFENWTTDGRDGNSNRNLVPGKSFPPFQKW